MSKAPEQLAPKLIFIRSVLVLAALRLGMHRLA